MPDKFGARKFARLTSDFSANRFSLNRIVNFLQTSHRNSRLRFFRRNCFDQRFRAGNGCHARHVKLECGFTDCLIYDSFFRGQSLIILVVQRRARI